MLVGSNQYAFLLKILYVEDHTTFNVVDYFITDNIQTRILKNLYI